MAVKEPRTDPGTAGRILDVAERLVQLRGFNAFSYADVAAELSITKASLHYHFRGKGELGEALILRYAARFFEALATIDTASKDAYARLLAYADLYGDVLQSHRMCLCGMLAAEFETLPGSMRDAVLKFFDDNDAWLARVLDEGRHDGSLRFTGSPRETAQTIVSGLEGALLVARPFDDPARFRSTARLLLASLSGASARPSP
jgi:TetR/AcrR family transcriptional regulator, transcriptional repressor for nem operon